MTEKKTALLPSRKLITIAAVAGLISGLVAVYMMGHVSGNGTNDAQSVDCSASDQKNAILTPHLKGNMAALIAQNPSRFISVPAFKDDKGASLTLTTFKGKVQLVNLWATWCVPCRAEMPALNALQKSLGGKNFQVTAINLDTNDPEKPAAFLKENGIDSLKLYRDDQMKAFTAFKKAGLAFGLPFTALIDKNGCLLASMNGPAAWESSEAQALISAMN